MNTPNTIRLEYDSGVATITLNRPDKRNAISFELIDDLLRALQEVETSDAIVLILTGAGKAFSSGMDLDDTGKNADRPFSRAEPAGFGKDGPLVPCALRISESDDCCGEWRGHRGRHWTGFFVRFHSGCAGSQVRLYGSSHRLCAGRIRFDLPVCARSERSRRATCC